MVQDAGGLALHPKGQLTLNLHRYALQRLCRWWDVKQVQFDLGVLAEDLACAVGAAVSDAWAANGAERANAQRAHRCK